MGEAKERWKLKNGERHYREEQQVDDAPTPTWDVEMFRGQREGRGGRPRGKGRTPATGWLSASKQEEQNKREKERKQNKKERKNKKRKERENNAGINLH